MRSGLWRYLNHLLTYLLTYLYTYLLTYLPSYKSFTCRSYCKTYIYASSSWWGFTSASDRQRLEGFLRRGRRYGLHPADQPTIVQLIEEADETLLNNIRHNPLHILHPFYPNK